MLKGQTALVTGANSGIGRAIAIALGKAGANVDGQLRDASPKMPKQSRRNSRATGKRAMTAHADVADEAQVQAMFAAAVREFGTVDILVSNAGMERNAPFHEMTVAQWDAVMNVNLRGAFLCAREAVREFLRRGVRPDVSVAAGKIIFISSVHEVIPWAGHVNYAASKGGLMLLMKSLAQEVAEKRIRVNSIAPGAIRTPINTAAWSTPEAYAELMKLVPYKRIGEVEEIGTGRGLARLRLHRLSRGNDAVHRRRHDTLSWFRDGRLRPSSCPQYGCFRRKDRSIVSSMSHSRSWRAAIAALGLLPLSALCDDPPNVLSDALYIAVGTFVVNTDTTLRLDGDAGEQGKPIDWEKNFGEGDVNRFRLDGYWRFADRHKVRAMVFSSSRSGSRTLADDIEWGGETFQTNATINGKVKFSIYELAYEYAFMRRENYEVAASFGLHYADYEATLEGTATATGTGGPVTGRREKSGSVGAPLPVFGLRGTWLLGQTFSIDLSGQFFSLTYGDIEGDIQDYRLLLNWQPKSWLGLGIGYDHFAVDVDVSSDNFRGKMNWAYDGPMIFYGVSF